MGSMDVGAAVRVLVVVVQQMIEDGPVACSDELKRTLASRMMDAR